MLKSCILFVFFCVIINSQSSFVFDYSKDARTHAQQAPKKDTVAKTAAAVKDTVTKAAAAEAKKGKGLLQKLIQPFKFNQNEKIRTDKNIHLYIFKDSATAAKQLTQLTKELPVMQTQLKQLSTSQQNQVKLQKKIDSVKLSIHLLDSALKVVQAKGSGKAGGPVVIDTPAKEKNQAPVMPPGNTTEIPKPENADAEQQKLNVLRLLYKGPITIKDTSKNKDTARIKQLTLSHKAKVLGFYADTAHADIRKFNFKMLTTLAYAINTIDGKTDNDEELANNMPVIDSALHAGCNIVLSVYNNDAASLNELLHSEKAKNSLIARIIRLLGVSKANGLNINFNGLNGHLNGYFVTFVASLQQTLQKTPQKYKISITIPADDKEVAYDLTSLDKYTDYFIVDFSKRTNSPGALAPLNNGSNNSIETCLALYLDKGIKPSKFVLGVSYRGVVWQNKPEAFLHYIAYNSVRANYSDATVIYTKGESAAHIEADYKKTYIDIWYDDEKTLGEKYDYALKNDLGGVAVKSLGDDNGYGELQKELAYKLLKIDTSLVGSILLKHSIGSMLSDFITLLTENPCGQHIDANLSTNLLIVNICVILIIVISVLVLFYQVKKYGESWKWRKQLIYFIMGMLLVLTFVFLMWLFFSTSNPFFGPTRSKHCISIPFIALYLILAAGIGVGIFIWWLYKLNNEEDVP